MRRRRHAFTLIELLLVVLLLASVMTVIMACFDGGFRVYSRIRAFSGGEADVYLAGERMAEDLRNMLSIRQLPFEGDALGMTFPAVLPTESGMPGLVMVQYRQDPDGAAFRVLAPMADGQWSESLSGGDLWLPDGCRATLAYQPADSGEAAGAFLDEWPAGTNLPAAVRLTVSGERLDRSPLVRTMVLMRVKGGS